MLYKVCTVALRRVVTSHRVS